MPLHMVNKAATDEDAATFEAETAAFFAKFNELADEQDAFYRWLRSPGAGYLAALGLVAAGFVFAVAGWMLAALTA